MKMSNTSDKTPLTETYIQFLIQIKRKDVEDFKEQLGQLEDKKQKLIKLREQEREEQTDRVGELLKDIEELDRNLEKTQQEKEQQVEQMGHEDLELRHELQKELEELHCKFARLQVQLEELQEERETRLRYKSESNTKDQQIEKLENNIALTQRIYQDISEHFQKSLVAVVEKNEQKVEKVSKEGYQLAFERAKINLDHHSKSDAEKHHWLKEEVPKFRKEVTVLKSTIHQLEEDNLAHVNCLFQMLQMCNAFIRRDSEFLGQAASFESHEAENMDRNIMNVSPEKTSELVDISQKPLQQSTGTQQEETQQNTEETQTPSTSPDLGKMFSVQANFREPMHLEQRELCVIGKAAHLHPPREEMTFDLLQTVTTKTINNKFRQPESDASEKDTCENQNELDEH